MLHELGFETKEETTGGGWALEESSGSAVKNLPANIRDSVLIPDLGRSPGEGNGNPLPVFLPGEFHEKRNLLQSMQLQKSGARLID